MIAFDTETHLIQPGLLAPPLVCGSFAEPTVTGGLSPYVYGPKATAQRFRELLERAHITGANIAYDLGVMAAADPALLREIFRALDEGRIHDLQIRQALDAIAGGHLGRDPRTSDNPQAMAGLRDPETGKQGRYSLAICADLQLGERIAKKDTFRMKYATLEGVPLEEWPREAIEYSQNDAAITWRVTESQEKHRNLHCESDEVRAAFALQLSAIWGMRTDPERVGPVVAEIDRQHAESRATFHRAGILKIRKAAADEEADDIPTDLIPEKWRGARVRYAEDRKTLAALVTAAYFGAPPRTPPSKTHPEGQVSTARDTLAESGDELLEAYAEAGPNEKLHSTYKKVLIQGTKAPINPRTNVLVASARASYGEPNLQNLPRLGGIRECFVARPGRVFCSVDYSTVELVTLAEVCSVIVGWSKLAEALNAGMDVHTLFASRIANADYSEFLKRVKAGDEVAQGLRQATKALNFGLPGGMGEAKLVLAKRKEGLRFCKALGAEVCGVEKVTTYKQKPIPPTCKRCLEIAAELRGEWFKMWPEMRDYFNHVAREVELDGSVESFGNGMMRGGLDFCNAANHRFQNLAAQAAKRSLYRISKECYTDPASALWDSRPVVFVHDEIICEMPEEKADAAAKRQAEIMIEELRALVPHVQGGAKAEPALMRRWLKKAEPVYRDGVLVPWEPKS